MDTLLHIPPVGGISFSTGENARSPSIVRKNSLDYETRSLLVPRVSRVRSHAKYGQ